MSKASFFFSYCIIYFISLALYPCYKGLIVLNITETSIINDSKLKTYLLCRAYFLEQLCPYKNSTVILRRRENAFNRILAYEGGT